MRSLILHALLVLALFTGASAQLKEKTLAAEPLPGVIGLQLEGKSAAERRILKATALAGVGKVANYAATKNARAFEIELREAPVVVGGVLVVYVRARENGQAVGLGIRRVEWERLRFVNPPVKVPAGTYREEIIDGQTVLVENMVEDAGAALREIIADAIGHIATTGPPAQPGSVGCTTTVIYPDGDSRLHRSSAGESWAAIHDGTGSVASAVTNSFIARIGTPASPSGTYNYLARAQYAFDTSVLSGQSVLSADFETYNSNKYNNFGSNPDTLDLDGCSPASPPSFVASDYESVSDTLMGEIAWGSVPRWGFMTIALNATGIAAIDTGGYTCFAARISWDFDDAEPTWAASASVGVKAYYVSQSGTTYDPKLTVESEPLPVSGTPAAGLLGAPF